LNKSYSAWFSNDFTYSGIVRSNYGISTGKSSRAYDSIDLRKQLPHEIILHNAPRNVKSNSLIFLNERVGKCASYHVFIVSLQARSVGEMWTKFPENQARNQLGHQRGQRVSWKDPRDSFELFPTYFFKGDTIFPVPLATGLLKATRGALAVQECTMKMSRAANGPVFERASEVVPAGR